MPRSDSTPSIPRRSDRRSAPLSSTQEGFWFLEQLAPGTVRHNMAMAMSLEGPLDPRALGEAFRLVVERHDILRSTVVDAGGGPRQVVQPPPRAVVRVLDVSAIGKPARRRAALRLARQAARQPFDLARGPLLRVHLWRLAGDDHILTTALHHIAGDAASLDVLMREVIGAYADVAAGRRAALPPLAIQYGDYAAWERLRRGEPARSTALEYWAKRLEAAEPLDLPTDRPRPAARTFRGASCAWSVGGSDFESLRRVASGQRATVFMIVLAAFATVLRRYTHQRTVSLGSPVSTRTPQTQPLIGPFLNTIVFCLDARGARPFQDFLGHVRDIVVDALAHGDVPFDRVVRRVRGGGALDDAPLFNVVVASRPGERTRAAAAGLRTRRLFLSEESAQYDLTLYVGADARTLGGVLNYSTELFDDQTIRRMGEHVTGLLRAIPGRLSIPLRDLPLVTDAEREQIATALTGPVAAPPGCAGVHELFDRQALETPDAIAVARGPLAITYRETARHADWIARLLATSGVRRGDRVALCLDRQPRLVAALLGVLKAGACYVPLDPGGPPGRLQATVRDAGAAMLLTERRFDWLALSLPEIACVHLDEGTPDPGEPIVRPNRTVTADDPAYVVYTSGSTGAPKGVVAPHGALLNSCAAVADATGIARGDRFLHFAPIGFDVSAFQIFPALTTGATIVLAAPPDELSNDDIVSLCDDGLTILDLPSAVWQEWIDDVAARRGRLPSTVRVFMTGGESTPVGCLRKWAAMADPSAVLVSSYGSTETAVTSIWRGRAGDVAAGRLAGVTLGRPVRNVRLDVRDAADHTMPPGASGELRVAGSGLCHGYLGHAGLTADRLRPDPGADRPGARLYRTGDRVRCRADGTLEFLGRLDQQVKVLGVRVEIEEIERLLRLHPRVRAAAVTAAPQAAPARRPLVAYVVAEEPAPTEMELREHLAACLPRAVLPGTYCLVPSLAVTPNGKIDRRALPPPREREPARPAPAARSLPEQLLIDMWAETLGTAPAGMSEDFFAAGGDSLSAARLSARLRDAFGVDVPVRAVFEARTVERLAQLVDLRRRTGGDDRPPLLTVPRDGPLDVSFAQQGFWLLQQFDVTSPIFANPEVVRLRGDLSVRTLARALTMVVERHETLRTAFTALGGRPKQIVGAPRPVDVPIVDLGGMPPAARERRAATLARDERRRPFDLTKGPLLRASALRMAADDHVILFTMHHLVSDGWSTGVLLHEVNAGYRATRAGDAPALEPLPVQYADYAVWQRARWTDDAFDRAVSERRQGIGDAVRGLDLPTDRPRPATQTFVGARHRLPLDDTTIRRVRALGRREGVTLFMSLLAALQVMLHRYTGQRSIAVAAPVANRTVRATERLIGLFVNHVLIATSFEGDPTCREVLRRARAATLDAFDHQELPYDELVRRLRPERHGTYTPLTPVLFNHMNVPLTPLDLPGTRLEPTRLGAPHRPRFDLEWTFVETADTVAATVGYDCALFDRSTVERMGLDYAAVIDTFLDTPDRPVSVLRLMTETQSSLAGAFSEPL